MHLKPEFFFNLLNYGHKVLFPSDKDVWNALIELPYYLGSMLAQPSGPYRAGSDVVARFPDVRFEKPHEVLIADGAQIGPFVHVEGRVVIEEGARVETGAHLVGPLLIGRKAVIGQGTQAKRSIFFPGAKAPHKNTVLDSIFGHDVNFAGHLITPNKRLSGKDVQVRMPDGSLVATGLRKLGLIAGDSCSFGCGLRFNPGDYYVSKTILYPGKRP